MLPVVQLRPYSFCFFDKPLLNTSASPCRHHGRPTSFNSVNIRKNNVRGKKFQRTTFTASVGHDYSNSVRRKREVVEHLCLLKAKEDLSDEKEKDMLDYFYTTQYHMGSIVAISLGRALEENSKNYTHAVYMRFQSKQDLIKFYGNPSYLQVLKEHVYPYCHELLYVDFSSEVEDDILPMFRKGEEFNYGVEFVLLIAFLQSALGGQAEDALSSLQELTTVFQTLIVQSTQGYNFNLSSKEYTHGIVIRFCSVEAFETFMGSSEYKNTWESKFQPIIQRTLCVHFLVDPVGTQLM